MTENGDSEPEEEYRTHLNNSLGCHLLMISLSSRKKKAKCTPRGNPKTREVEDSTGSWVPSSWQQ